MIRFRLCAYSVFRWQSDFFFVLILFLDDNQSTVWTNVPDSFFVYIPFLDHNHAVHTLNDCSRLLLDDTHAVHTLNDCSRLLRGASSSGRGRCGGNHHCRRRNLMQETTVRKHTSVKYKYANQSCCCCFVVCLFVCLFVRSFSTEQLSN